MATTPPIAVTIVLEKAKPQATAPAPTRVTAPPTFCTSEYLLLLEYLILISISSFIFSLLE